MEFEHSTKVKELQARVSAFMEAHIYPNEKLFDQQLDEGDTRWQIPPIMEELKAKAKADAKPVAKARAAPKKTVAKPKAEAKTEEKKK